jgi:dihydroorotase
VVDRTDCFTAADLAGLVASANLLVIQENIEAGKQLATVGTGESCTAPHEKLRDSSSCFVAVAGCASNKNLLEKLQEAVASTQALSTAPSVASKRTSQLITLSAGHMQQALESTRRSTTDADLAKQAALYDRFMKAREPGSGATTQPGTKVTFA